MDYGIIRKRIQKNVVLISMIKTLIKTARGQMAGAVYEQLHSLSKTLTEWIGDLSSLQTVLRENGFDLDALLRIFQSLLNAQESDDRILVADICESEFIPTVFYLQQILVSLLPEEELIDPEWKEKNMEVLKLSAPELYVKIQSIMEDETDFSDYRVEVAQNGALTLSVRTDDSYRYIHSCIDPIEEAEIYADRIYRIEEETYLVFGIGLGYHLQALQKRYADISLIVAEPDIRMLALALQYNDLSEIFSNITFLYGDFWEDFRTYMKNGAVPVLYRPALEVLQKRMDTGLYRRMTDLVNRQDAAYGFSEIFFQNCRFNLKHCDAYAEELEEKIRDKKVLIVAGGPSLDKNIAELTEKNDLCLIAVGTVYKKLLELDIHPDYVIAEDVGAYIQFENLPSEDAPVLLLSTVDTRIAKYYRGKKYLLCQKGYAQAAQYAKEQGYKCYDSGGSVATLALDFAIQSGAASVGFIGLDLAVNGKQTHATETLFTFEAFEAEHNVLGINGEELKTTSVYLGYKKWIEERIRANDCRIPIYDATEGGAKIEGTTICTLKEFLDC